MNYYARFTDDIKDNDGKLLFKKNDKTNKTRYYIASEDEKKYYIIMKPNDINCNKCCTFDKVSAGKMFEIVFE